MTTPTRPLFDTRVADATTANYARWNHKYLAHMRKEDPGGFGVEVRGLLHHFNTVGDAATACGIPKRTLYTWAKECGWEPPSPSPAVACEAVAKVVEDALVLADDHDPRGFGPLSVHAYEQALAYLKLARASARTAEIYLARGD